MAENTQENASMTSAAAEFMKAIDAFVQPLVNEQRVFETTVVGCKTKQELDALTIPFTE